MNIFVAGVQYDDFKGTVAADVADMNSILEKLKSDGVASQGEMLAGIRIGFSENSGRDIDVPGVVAYLYDDSSYNPSPKNIRAVEIDLPIAQFFSFFKRFDLVMVRKGMSLDDANVDGPHLD